MPTMMIKTAEDEHNHFGRKKGMIDIQTTFGTIERHRLTVEFVVKTKRSRMKFIPKVSRRLNANLNNNRSDLI
jgi:hypothetical protein